AKDRFRNPRALTTFMSQDEFELRFLSNDQFELKSMEGNTTLYRRARPYAPTAADLQTLAGRYGSEEMDAVFRIVPAKDGLTVRLEHAPQKSLEFKPADPDTFQRGAMLVRFVRDKDGKVVALDYSNPLLRNIRFTRLP
ncbi:MAG TPA: hypothetical protein VHK90_11065, partial [Thermoanaerobaculia bacterium]|nr:hypothetical protein [Thermoanaerobaculia bacterium]